MSATGKAMMISKTEAVLKGVAQCICVVLLLGLGAQSFAQDMEGVQNDADVDFIEAEASETDVADVPERQVKSKNIDPNSIPSLFFTPGTLALIRDARFGLVASLPGEGSNLPTGPREIGLQGIVYNGVDEWTIWLNDQRVTPRAIPPEVIDLRVTEKYIDLKWFDASTNAIYPIRLRPHQRFNLDAKLFLPG